MNGLATQSNDHNHKEDAQNVKISHPSSIEASQVNSVMQGVVNRLNSLDDVFPLQQYSTSPQVKQLQMWRGVWSPKAFSDPTPTEHTPLRPTEIFLDLGFGI